MTNELNSTTWSSVASLPGQHPVATVANLGPEPKVRPAPVLASKDVLTMEEKVDYLLQRDGYLQDRLNQLRWFSRKLLQCVNVQELKYKQQQQQFQISTQQHQWQQFQTMALQSLVSY
jgi:hypothetical protein